MNKLFIVTALIIIIYLIAGPETAGAGAVLGAMGASVQERRKRQREREQVHEAREVQEDQKRETEIDQARATAEKRVETWLDSDF
mgnify:CR=1 FL=1